MVHPMNKTKRISLEPVTPLRAVVHAEPVRDAGKSAWSLTKTRPATGAPKK
jgi:hypothetical protein